MIKLTRDVGLTLIPHCVSGVVFVWEADTYGLTFYRDIVKASGINSLTATRGYYHFCVNCRYRALDNNV